MTAPASRRYLAIWLPMLAEDIWRLADPAARPRGQEPPTVFVEKINNAMRLTALSRSALALGLMPNLTLADARARVPELVVHDRDHGGEARLLARIVAGCARYTPMAAAAPPDGAILDITGCTHAFDGEAGLGQDLAARLAQGGVTALLDYGDTPEQARALARFGRGKCDLFALPVEALEAEAPVTLALRRAGLKTIGALARRPRKMLAARFGDLAIRLGRLLGEQDRHITPERPLPPVFALRRFAEPIGRVEDALACLEDLGRDAAETLLERHEGGRRFLARLFRSDGAVAMVEVTTGQPTRDPALLIRLFRERIDALSDPIDPGFGFDLIRLDVGGTEKLVARQDDHLATARHKEELAELVDRLSARLGARRIYRARPENTHIPECAAVACAPSQSPSWEAAPEGEPPMRPVRLLDPPQPVGAVMSEVPDGPPMRFTWCGRAYSIARWEGPERIAAEWWHRRDRGGKPRDYYRVEDADGHRFWLFRHGQHTPGDEEPGWYIHGLFA
ncbi:MAG TPA: DNA polymerase Y family protein [Sphingomonas sp.]|uniref:Y-family DNA polymerase n=1 Tax=Sphingomonas sp. TaxID=28214 RepID=UPI002BC3C2DF|nr:DNA polymerase Y family protein [Sphingomonas sp.]HMI18826.1 DNA polymerase Y family protein [Sphingomonas sp.]